MLYICFLTFCLFYVNNASDSSARLSSDQKGDAISCTVQGMSDIVQLRWRSYGIDSFLTFVKLEEIATEYDDTFNFKLTIKVTFPAPRFWSVLCRAARTHIYLIFQR